MTKPLIQHAFIYKAKMLENLETLQERLQAAVFHETEPFQMRSIGFICPVESSGNLVHDFSGGYAFRVRLDEKKIPGKQLDKLLKKKVAAYQAETGRVAGKKLRKELKEVAIAELTPHIFPSTSTATVFYDIESELLVVATGSKGTADAAVSLLVSAIGSLETTTLHVCDIKGGLTSRMSAWLDETRNPEDRLEAFGEFHPCGEALLQDAEKNRVAVKMAVLETARGAISEAISRGSRLHSLGLNHAGSGASFTLTHEFRIRSLNYSHDPVSAEGEEYHFSTEAILELGAIRDIVADLLALLDTVQQANSGEDNGEATP